MFVYKITVLPIDKVYIGLDTKPVYKKFRWKDHCKEAKKDKSQRKIHTAMREHGIENCAYEVLETGFESFGSLALAEINYIKQYDSYTTGLNSSPGGDGLSAGCWIDFTDEEILTIKQALGEHWKDWNKKKWANTTAEQRKDMVKCAHTPEVNARRKESLKEYYKFNPDAGKQKGKKISDWQKNNRETMISNNKKNSLKGAAKVSKSIKVEHPDGSVLHYPSKSEFQRKTGQWAKTIIEKTFQGMTYKGYRAWEI